MELDTESSLPSTARSIVKGALETVCRAEQCYSYQVL